MLEFLGEISGGHAVGARLAFDAVGVAEGRGQRFEGVRHATKMRVGSLARERGGGRRDTGDGRRRSLPMGATI